ncbi:hypothetical protein CCR85_09405 [Rhodothalassium salexigens]|uniref:peptidoglycan D,D-transpeptidase FtsI family protein n=1 Tax=Rhodothalassium salexigens TaxID=1086 RepID=UPI001913A09D|nr:penicillin-binding protein 2 [Rhodothalassium salexigens]MBK5911701.1 hypothetical protein [Rhodothalassium salexigens]MBK5919710.1 hypothetical protein [Rhodothalassium salexigens]
MIRIDRLFRLQRPSLDQAHQRLSVLILLFAAGFLVVAGRAVDLGVFQYAGDPTAPANLAEADHRWQRAEIVDRRGEVLATTVASQWLYADPRRIQKPEETALALAEILPGQTAGDILRRFRRPKEFVWIEHNLTPSQVAAVNALGEPGLNFKTGSLRLYPHGRLAAHALGYTGIDGEGLAGLEKFFDRRLTDPARLDEPLRLSLDLRVQHAATDELALAMDEFQAKGAVALVMDVHSGELLSLVSLPDYNANRYAVATPEQKRNRATYEIYEQGSALKAVTIAAALDAGLVRLDDRIDATKPIRIAGYTIHDFHGQRRDLTVPEVFTYSSNIGSARLGDTLGAERQKRFFRQVGLLSPAEVEVTEVSAPRYPERWGRIHTMTASFGHGVSISSVQLAQAMAAMVNGGRLQPATLLADADRQGRHRGRQVISPETSAVMRQLMRVAVVKGTGSFADVPGYRVAGKTSTAEKPGQTGGYDHDRVLSSFTGVFPAETPRYLVFAMLDEPHGTEATYQFAGGGWVAAPTVGKIIARIGPLLGVEPRPADQTFIREAALLVQEKE